MAISATTAALSPLPRRSGAPIPSPSTSYLKPSPLFAIAQTPKRPITCHVILQSNFPSPSSLAEDESAAPEMVGKRIRVRTPVKVYHVSKVPEIDLLGMEGEIKQCIRVWKGKNLSASLPFKVEFLLAERRFFAHLRESEFELLS